jgi:hypothetical protein
MQRAKKRKGERDREREEERERGDKMKIKDEYSGRTAPRKKTRPELLDFERAILNSFMSAFK